MKKHFSVPVKLSIRLTFLITFFLCLLYILFTSTLFRKLSNNKAKEISKVAENIALYLEDYDVSQLDTAVSSVMLELSYYANYIVYDKDSKNIYAYTDELFPILKESEDHVKHFKIMSYYLDGNLDVLYKTKFLPEKNMVIQVWFDIANDSLIKIVSSMPFILPYLMFPVILLTFMILYFTLSKTFNREHNFSANVSHELQTPVNAILGHANMLARWGKEDPVQVEKSLQVIINEAHSMQATIKNLLQMTRLEEKQIQLTEIEIDIAEFFNSLKEEFSLIENSEMKIEINGIENPVDETVFFKTDRELLHQVFVIAISNSLKFCTRPCTIILRYYIEGKNIFFEIQDDGKGFSKEIIPYVFNRFYRGDEAHSRSKGGAGLGLSIGKSIVTALGGKISAHNVKDTGAIIRLEFKNQK